MWLKSSGVVFLVFGFRSTSAENFVHLIAPADVRKDGGLKFRANLPVPDTVEELKQNFRAAHLERHGPPGYDEFDFFSTRLEEVLLSVDQLEDGDELRLFRKRGTQAQLSQAQQASGAASGGTAGAVGTSATGAGAAKGNVPAATPQASKNGRKDAGSDVANTKKDAPSNSTSSPTSLSARVQAPNALSVTLPDASSPFYVSELLYMLTRPQLSDADRDLVLRSLRDAQLSDFQRKQILEDFPVTDSVCQESSDSSFREFATAYVHLNPSARGILLLADCDPTFRESLVRAQFARQWEQYGSLLSAGQDASEGQPDTDQGADAAQSTFFPGYIGQGEAMRMVKPLVLEQMLGRRISDAPLSFLFLGPSGVGKTELARKVAEKIHCPTAVESASGSSHQPHHPNSSPCNIKSLTQSGKFVEFKMGNYRNEEQFTSWIGVPDGVKGSDGKLSEVLMQNPDAVIYLDEIEKAISTAGDLLLAMLDNKGSVQVAKTGQHISTVKATFILSSNLATNDILQVWSYYPRLPYEQKYAKILEKIDPALAQSKMFARPEVRNRIAAIVPFTPFLHNEVRQVILLELQKLRKSYKRSAGWGRPNIVWTEEVVELFADPVRNVHFENAVSKGNLRELIRFLEQSVNRALNTAKDCENPKCDLLQTGPTICRPKASDLFSGASDNYVLDVDPRTKTQIVANSVPVTIREAFVFCELSPPEPTLSEAFFGAAGPDAPSLLENPSKWFSNLFYDAPQKRPAIMRPGKQPLGSASSSSAYHDHRAARQPQRVSTSSSSPSSASSSASGSSSAATSSRYETEMDYAYDRLWTFLFEYQKSFSIAVAWIFFFSIGFWSAAIAFAVLNYGILPLSYLAYTTWRSLPPSVQHVVMAGGRVIGQIGKQAVRRFDISFMLLLFLEYRFGLCRKVFFQLVLPVLRIMFRNFRTHLKNLRSTGADALAIINDGGEVGGGMKRRTEDNTTGIELGTLQRRRTRGLTAQGEAPYSSADDAKTLADAIFAAAGTPRNDASLTFTRESLADAIRAAASSRETKTTDGMGANFSSGLLAGRNAAALSADNADAAMYSHLIDSEQDAVLLRELLHTIRRVCKEENDQYGARGTTISGTAGSSTAAAATVLSKSPVAPDDIKSTAAASSEAGTTNGKSQAASSKSSAGSRSPPGRKVSPSQFVHSVEDNKHGTGAAAASRRNENVSHEDANAEDSQTEGGESPDIRKRR
ncbi:unnamed protein product [Amoebophrya sp. A120]|nr:unnamed protein product [Amoebophrya sp. A120]|eukprot:GSA120T00005332001.1